MCLSTIQALSPLSLYPIWDLSYGLDSILGIRYGGISMSYIKEKEQRRDCNEAKARLVLKLERHLKKCVNCRFNQRCVYRIVFVEMLHTASFWHDINDMYEEFCDAYWDKM